MSIAGVTALAALLLTSITAGAQTTAPASRPTSMPTSSASSKQSKPDRSAGYKLEPGPLAIGIEPEFQLYDKQRDKTLHTRVVFPQNAPADTKLPLLIFSHGAGGASDAFPELTQHWASHGYVVILPTHSDSLALRRKSGDDLSALRTNPDALLQSVKPLERLADVRLILDSLEKIEAKIPQLREKDSGRIDRARIGMAGHSAGAYTTQVAFGVKVRGPRARSDGATISVGDERIKAAILISGQGLTNRSLSENSWSDIKRPMLVIAGSEDVARIGNETPASRRHPFEYAPPGGKYLLYLEGATHSSYQGKTRSRILAEPTPANINVITDAVSASTLAFWDAHLSNDRDAIAYLQSEKLIALTGGAAEFRRK